MMISQALAGRAPSLEAPTLRSGAHPVLSGAAEEKRKKDFEKGIKLTIIGSAFIGVQFFTFLLSLPFRSSGSPFGFFSFVALIMMAIGISKIVGSRPPVSALSAVSGAGPVRFLQLREAGFIRTFRLLARTVFSEPVT